MSPQNKKSVFQGQNTSVMWGASEKPFKYPQEKITSSESTNSSYQNIHLQRLMLEKPRSDRGGRKRPEGKLCLLHDGG